MLPPLPPRSGVPDCRKGETEASMVRDETSQRPGIVCYDHGILALPRHISTLYNELYTSHLVIGRKITLTAPFSNWNKSLLKNMRCNDVDAE